MDRTKDLIVAAERFLDTASLPPEQTRQLREAVLLGRRSRSPGSFAVAAKGVEDSIGTLWGSIRSMQQEYLKDADALAEPDATKDANEAQLAAVIKRIGGYIDRLKQAAASAQKTYGSSERVNEHTAAHMHGVVLILAERLHRAARSFDRLRAGRYQALVQQQPQQQRQRGPLGTAVAKGAGLGGGGGSSGSASALASWPHVLGVRHAVSKGYEERAGADADFVPAAAAAAASSSAAVGKGGGGGGGQGAEWPVQVQAVEQENRALLERLTATRSAALSVEKAVHDVAALNQMFSTAVLTQAETIESIYMAAVEATHNITAGNKSLEKTVAVNRSTSRYILVLLLVATVLLLFFDWFNS